jgi:hypothetical protein
LFNIDTPDKKQWWNNPCLKTLWFILSFFLGIFAVCFLVLFFCFFGCCYEFVKCYLTKKTEEDDDEDSDIESQPEYSQHNIEDGNGNHPPSSHRSNKEIEEDKCKKNSIIGLLIFLGILCQPLYVIFYCLYGLMECYRRFSCWFYYVDY